MSEQCERATATYAVIIPDDPSGRNCLGAKKIRMCFSSEKAPAWIRRSAGNLAVKAFGIAEFWRGFSIYCRNRGIAWCEP